MLEGALVLWFSLTLLSLIFVVYDQFTNTPSMRVMTLAWALIILYTGPIGLFFYFLSCRQPMPGTHDAFISSHWKQALGSEIHCVAGDATAIIIMAAILSKYDLPNGIESIIEYAAAYLFGLLIFQALFMRSMFSSYKEAVMRTIFAETISMNAVMAGMLPTILICKHIFPEGGNPSTLLFWGIMSLATLMGSLFAYPVNSWLVRIGIKHGMMSIPQEGEHMHHHEPAKLPLHQQIKWTVLSFIGLFGIGWLASLIIPLRF
ncbi:MAG: DUF4396 domain-containing protein [Chlamydiales bacterium]|nr:DUF4396 domain-containing protein [Chlamydiales bacterium]